MSRLKDILDLLESANDFYFVNPHRNVRAVYIQIDDICELTMKSWLYEESLRRQKVCQADLQSQQLLTSGPHKRAATQYFRGEISPADFENALGLPSSAANKAKFDQVMINHPFVEEWTAEKRAGGFKNFMDLIREIKDVHPVANVQGQSLTAPQLLHDLLDRIDGRRANRNAFFHNHRQVGLTVSAPNCLEALVDCFFLIETLFDSAFTQYITSDEHIVVRLQIAVLRLKKLGVSQESATAIYEEVLEGQPPIRNHVRSPIFEYQTLHNNPRVFHEQIRSAFDNKILEAEQEIKRLDEKTRKRLIDINRVSQLQGISSTLKSVYEEYWGGAWQSP
ncbi:hypothetical protein EON83_20655 [bacterium]|nr:MAG: hypothetical protein EON83_20655 [bacterium]